MRFRLLGPISVEASGEPVLIKRPRHLAVLAYLLLHRNTFVSTDGIVYSMWAADSPSTARNQVQSDVSIIRRAIRASGWQDPIQTKPCGYMLQVSAGELDLDDFLARTAAALATKDPASAAESWRSGLGLWTGTALAGVSAAYASSYRIHLEEQRLVALEHLFEAELLLDRHSEITTELLGLIRQHPLRERLVAQLMLALYRAGRHADALAHARQLRARLIEQHGLDPGSALQKLEQAILRQDPALNLQPEKIVLQPEKTLVAPEFSVPRQLPRNLPGIAGRQPQLAQLDRVLASGKLAVAVLTGTAGVGKTALAVHWGHCVAAHFPDGQLFVNLRGFGPDPDTVDPADALRTFLASLGEPASRLPNGLEALIALYRTQMASRRMLVVLDNARSAAQVMPLLPGSPHCMVVVTSRDQLHGLVATEGAHVVVLDVLTEAEATELLALRLGPGRVTAEPEASAAISARCARLPLALAIGAAKAASRPEVSLRAIASELHNAQSALDAFEVGEGGHGDIRVVFSWSYEALSGDAAALFRAAGSELAGEITIAAAASFTATSPARAQKLLAELARAHLLTQTRHGRYSAHDLLRAYAREAASAPVVADQIPVMTRRILDYYLHSAWRAAVLFQPGRHPLDIGQPVPGLTIAPMTHRSDAIAWLGAEHNSLVNVVIRAGFLGYYTHAWQLAWCLAEYLHRQGHWADSVRIHAAAVQAAQHLREAAAVSNARSGLGRALIKLGRYADALSELNDAYADAVECGDDTRQVFVLHSLSELHGHQGQYKEAIVTLARALEIRAAKHPPRRASILNSMGWQYGFLGEFSQTLALGQEARAIYETSGDLNGMAAALDTLGFGWHGSGDLVLAIEHYQRAIDIRLEVGESYEAASSLRRLGEVHLDQGDQQAAAKAWQRAAEILEPICHPDLYVVRAKLAAIG